ncbi:MAG: peptide permease, partial [Paenibacillus sp.]|nr:peptide permease [Paenibacillus sp.]
YASQLIRGYNVIPAGTGKAASVVRMLDFIAGKGHNDLKLGFQNEIWRWENGKMVTNFAEHDKHLYRGIYSALVDVVEPDTDKQRLDSLGEHFHLYDNQKRIENNLIPNRFTGLPTTSMGKYMSKLNTSILETFIKMVVGVTPIGEFEKYVERWQQEGLQDITREVNAWYAETTR